MGKRIGILDYIKKNKTYLNDFFHCLSEHDNDEDFEYIFNNLIAANCQECNANSCLMMKRNYRNRTTMSNEDNVRKREDIYFEFIANSKEVNAEQLFDKIHCYFYHQYDIGFRLNADLKKSLFDAYEFLANEEEQKHDFEDEKKKDRKLL